MKKKKRILNLLLCLTMVVTMYAPGGLPIFSAAAAGGNMTIIASQDTYVQGSSQAAIAKGTEDPNNLIGRDWSDKPKTPSAYQLPYLQFEIPSINEFDSIDNIKAVTLKVFCMSGKNDEYIVGLSNLDSIDENTLTYNDAIAGEKAYPDGANHSRRLNFDHDSVRVAGSERKIESAANEWIEFNITDLIKKMIEENDTGSSRNVVLVLAPRSRVDNPSLAYHGSVLFASKEYQDGIYAPRIEISADSLTEKSEQPIDDYYTDWEENILQTEELYVSTAHSTVAEFSTSLDMFEDDELSEAKIVFSKIPGSPMSNGLTAELLDSVGDSTGTALSIIEESDSAIIVDVTEELKKLAGTGKNLTVRLSSDNEEHIPLMLYSSRTSVSGTAETLFYTVKYSGSIYSIEPTGRRSIEIPLNSITEEGYSFTAYDQYGMETDTGGLIIEFSLDSAPSGVSITSGGMLTVLPEAMPGTAVIRVSRSDMPEISGTIEVDIRPQRPERAELTGGLKAKVPSKELPLRKNYICKLYDAQGYLLPAAAVKLDWQILQAPQGVSVEPVGDDEAELIIDNKDETIVIGDIIVLRAAAVNYPDVYADITIEVGEEDEVYSTINFTAAEDTFIKQSDYAQSGNVNSNELLAKLNTKSSFIIPTLDYFSKESTNREIYLKFNGLGILPEDIISARLVLTTREDYNETAASPASGMPKAEAYLLNDADWSEEEGTITTRPSVDRNSKVQSSYSTVKDSEVSFDITEALRSRIEADEDMMAFRVGMEPINNNGYVHKYYSKEATYTDAESGISYSIPESSKPHLEITASYVRIPTALELVGEKDAGIMLRESSYEYKVYLTDQFNQRYTDNEMAEYKTSVKLKETYNGVTLENGILTVSPEAASGDIEVEISAEQFPELTTTETITLYKAEVAQVVLSGPDSIQLPPSGETVSAEYEMSAYDQKGVLVEFNDIVYELKEDQVGVSVERSTGTVRVEDYALANREIVIRAYSEEFRTVNAEKTVRLLPMKELTGKEQHPNLLYGNDDLPALREKLNVEPFASYYNNLKQSADTYTAEELQYVASTDPREADDEYDHVYPLVEVDEDGNERVLDRKRPWQWMMTDLFYTQGNFVFTPPADAKYVRAQAIAKGQGITNFDKFTLKLETGGSIELYNPGFETGNRRYVDEDIPYTDGSDYQVVETSKDGEWEYLNDVSKPMPDGMYYIRRTGSNSEFEWDDQKLHRDKVTTDGERAAKIRNNTVSSEAGISTDKFELTPGRSYVLSTGFGANDKLVGENGRLPEYSPLDKTAGLYMKVVYYDANGEEIGEETWMDNPQKGKPMNINWQVKPLRRSFDTMYDGCNTIYAVTRNIEYALRAKEYLKYHLEDMVWGMKYRTTTGYNTKMNDTYEAVHVGRYMQRNALAYDMIYDSGVISEEEDAEIRQMFNDIAYELTSKSYFNYANASGQIHNYNADRISGLTLYMLCFPENEGTEKNDYKDNFDFFYDHVMNEKNVWSFPTLLKNGIYDAGEEYGGMWCENIRYHGSVHAGWILSAKALDRYNPDFNYLQSDEMKKMARMWITAQGPKLTVSTDAKNLAGYLTVGDSYWRESVDMAAWCAAIYKSTDPQLSRELMYTWDRMGSALGGSYAINIIMDNDPTLPRENPKLGSMQLDNIGYTYFRQNFDILGEENVVLIPNSPGYGNGKQPIHDHSDRGSFAYIANGVPMSLDSGVGSYFGSDTAFWRSSRSHNEILFWSDRRGWLSNAGGDGNSYTSDTAKKKNYDSKTVDVFFSQELDRATVQVNPAQRDGKDTNLQWNRHFAYIKDGINALIFWDEVLNTRRSQFNLYMASTSYSQSKNIVTANMHGNMQMEVHMLNAEDPDISDTWVPSSGKYGIPMVDGSEQQQLIQYEQSNGEDYLTVLYPKTRNATGLKQTAIETPDGITAFKMTKEESGKSFYVAYNDSGAAAKFVISEDVPVRNPQTDEIIEAGGSIDIPAGTMLVFVDESVEKPVPERIEISGDNVIGIPSGDEMLSYTYDARVFDNYGNTIDDAEAEFAIENDVQGCSIEKDGTLLIDSNFSGGKIIVSARYDNAKSTMEVTAAGGGTSAVSSVDIDGSNTLTIPSSGSSTYTYKCMFKNSSGDAVSNAKPLWSILDPVEGVSINSYTGVITIQSSVKPGTIIHVNVAHFNDPSITKTVEAIFVLPAESGIYINAPAEIAVGGKEVTVILEGYVTDQMGNKFGDSEIEYSLKNDIDGVSLESSGKLTVSNDVSLAGKTIVIEAVSKSKPDNTAEIRIPITLNEPSSISISGKDTIVTSTGGAEAVYTAEIKDKNGDVMVADVTWSVRGISDASVENGTVVISRQTSGVLTLTAAVSDYPDISTQKKINVSTNNSSAAGGNGSGGGGSGSVSVPITTPSVPNTDPGGNAGDDEFRFDDVPESHWASTYIYSLYKIGAVNGRTATTFEPEENVSRAEFVKMLLEALELNGTETSEQRFTDSQPGDWYYPYVQKAAALGIVNGISEDYFGAAEQITREQMAAIIYRAGETLGIEFEPDTEDFADFEAISEYAAAAVMALKKANILNGKDGNMFMPKENATRAESAKVIESLRVLANR